MFRADVLQDQSETPDSRVTLTTVQILIIVGISVFVVAVVVGAIWYCTQPAPAHKTSKATSWYYGGLHIPPSTSGDKIGWILEQDVRRTAFYSDAILGHHDHTRNFMWSHTDSDSSKNEGVAWAQLTNLKGSCRSTIKTMRQAVQQAFK
jgi:hypothetical protein